MNKIDAARNTQAPKTALDKRYIWLRGAKVGSEYTPNKGSSNAQVGRMIARSHRYTWMDIRVWSSTAIKDRIQ
jgi:hypothetical protein